jgi:hypothetical protein
MERKILRYSIIDIDTKPKIATLVPKHIAGSGCCRINLLIALWPHSEIALECKQSRSVSCGGTGRSVVKISIVTNAYQLPLE